MTALFKSYNRYCILYLSAYFPANSLEHVSLTFNLTDGLVKDEDELKHIAKKVHHLFSYMIVIKLNMAYIRDCIDAK